MKINFWLLGAVLSANIHTAQAATDPDAVLQALNVEPHTPLVELNATQLVQIVQASMQSVTLAQTVCADFTALNLGQHYAPGQSHAINGVTLFIGYGGGARVSDHPLLPGQTALEMVEDGAVYIDLPISAEEVTVEFIAAGNDANEITFFNQGTQLQQTLSSQWNAVETVQHIAAAIDTVQISRPELYLSRVCYR